RHGAALAPVGTERHPEAEPVHPACQGHPARVGFGNLGPGARSPADVAEHFWIRIELDLQVEMAVGERDQEKAGGSQNGLRHLATIASRRRRRNPFTACLRMGRWPVRRSARAWRTTYGHARASR